MIWVPPSLPPETVLDTVTYTPSPLSDPISSCVLYSHPILLPLFFITMSSALKKPIYNTKSLVLALTVCYLLSGFQKQNSEWASTRKHAPKPSPLSCRLSKKLQSPTQDSLLTCLDSSFMTALLRSLSLSLSLYIYTCMVYAELLSGYVFDYLL